MAQPTCIEYLGSVYCTGGASVTTASILATYSTATALIMTTEGISVSINGSPMFPAKAGEITYMTTGKTYVFDKDCIIAVGIFKAI